MKRYWWVTGIVAAKGNNVQLHVSQPYAFVFQAEAAEILFRAGTSSRNTQLHYATRSEVDRTIELLTEHYKKLGGSVVNCNCGI